MSFEFEGTEIETNAGGYLTDQSVWTEAMAHKLAEIEGIELSERSLDIINFLREEYFENRETQPNTRTIGKAMTTAWGEKQSQKDLYALFPGDPSKQGAKVAGLPESRRKGGY
jgi:TusE/DsrC/DsvC family sulfur relay protein